jgi:hypothetical protein
MGKNDGEDGFDKRLFFLDVFGDYRITPFLDPTERNSIVV